MRHINESVSMREVLRSTVMQPQRTIEFGSSARDVGLYERQSQPSLRLLKGDVHAASEPKSLGGRIDALHGI